LVAAACSATPGAGDPSKGPDYTTDLQKLCEAETRAGAIDKFPFAAKQEVISGWLDQQLHDEAVRTLYYERLLQSPVHQQGDVLRGEAANAGLERCPMASLMDFLAELPIKALTTDDCIRLCVERNRLEGEERKLCERGCGAS
jgi:hypothetical protein